MARIFKILKKKRKYIEDIILNIMANAIPLIVLQLLLLPRVNAIVGENVYGLIVTIVSVLTFVTSTSAGSLNNVRLLLDSKYQQEKIEGDFNIIQLFFSVLNALLVVILSLFYTRKWSLNTAILLIIATVLICSEGYYSVGFRLQLNYRRILIQKLFLTVGYIIGYFFFIKTNQWLMIYIIGYFLDLTYVLIKTDLVKEQWKLTKLFKLSLHSESILIIAALIGGASSYIDRLFIYPVYGGFLTTTYYVSTLLGKGIALGTFPISGVLLSYFSKKSKLEDKTVTMMIIFAWIAGMIGYVFCITISRPLLGILYPTVVDDAMKYVPVTLFASVVNIQNTIISPVVLKYCKITRQIWISITNIICYVVISITFMHLWGLMGFCVASVITAFLKNIIYLYLYKKDKK